MEMNFKEYLQYTNKEENLQKLFYNMSITMKYIHNYGYCITSYDASDIKIRNIEQLSPIQFKKLKKLPANDNGERMNQDIHDLALLQVGSYTGLLDYMRLHDQKYEHFLKDNYEEYKSLLPTDDERYFDGMINRDSAVYYSDFVNRRNELRFNEMQKELSGGQTSLGGMQKVKATATGSIYSEVDKETIKLYESLNENRQAAFANFLVLPLTMILLGIVSSLIIFFFS